MEQGIISKWNDEKGFGFIAPDSGKQEIFFHISAFSDRSNRPKSGDRVFFDVTIENAEKIKAKYVGFIVNRSDSKSQNKTITEPTSWNSNSRSSPYRKARKKVGNYVLFLILPVVVIFAFCKHSSNSSNNDKSIQIENQSEQNFTCAGKRHCGQMTSKKEAQFYLENCPHDEMDGDKDGSACEQQFGQ